MAKPRIFVSSTYYDLKHIRKGIQEFIHSLGYESVLFESGEIPFSHSEPLDVSCYKEVQLSQILVLIIGGRYGSPTSEDGEKLKKKDLNKRISHYNSITKQEYVTAREKDIPIYIFISKGVASEYQTYKKNKSKKKVKYAHVDNVEIFKLLEDIYAEHRNNLCREFENLNDITDWLRIQWAGLFSSFLENKPQQKSIQSLESQVQLLQATINGLKNYTESLIRKTKPDDFESMIEQTNKNISDKNIEVTLRKSEFLSHLIDTHEYDVVKILDVIENSLSVEELRKSLIQNMPKDETCGRLEFDPVFKFELDSINKARKKIFGLHELKN